MNDIICAKDLQKWIDNLCEYEKELPIIITRSDYFDPKTYEPISFVRSNTSNYNGFVLKVANEGLIPKDKLKKVLDNYVGDGYIHEVAHIFGIKLAKYATRNNW